MNYIKKTKQSIFEENYINLAEHEFSRPIYRIFNLSYFMESFVTKTLVLSKPKSWDDPFENLFMNSPIIDKQENFLFMESRNDFFAQCWTLNSENDAMWRIYSQNKNGIKVRTTINKLFNALYNSLIHNENRDFSCFIGKVKYYTKSEMLNFITKNEIDGYPILSASGKNLSRTLLIKRLEFEHENEIRIIFDSGNSVSGDIFRFIINPYDLFDEIVFDPRMDFFTYEALRSFILGMKYTNNVSQSDLYHLENRPIKL